MPEWTQLLKHPAGALPPNMIRTAGIAFFSVVMAGLVFSTMWSGSTDDAGEALPGSEPNLTGAGQVAQLTSRLTDLQDEQTRLHARAAEDAQREADAAHALAGLFAQGGGTVETAGLGAVSGGVIQGLPNTGTGNASGGGPGVVLTPDEIELRARLRLENLERRARSLRTPAMVQTFRPAPVIGAIAPAAQPETPAPAAHAETPAPAPFDPLAMMSHISEAAAAAAGAGGDAEEVPPWERTVPGVTGPAIAATAEAVSVTRPNDPPGVERVYEGSVVSGVLVTQLSGDFAGPVEAHVSIPFYSSDRQRILIPRGARFLGTVQPVRDQDQSRLAVGFHRLIWPDGRWVDLAFHGLNGIGEGALRDQVNRHYVSMFAAAGAVGVIAGLTLQGAGNPYEGGRAGFQSGVSQGLGSSASQMLDRFLNRLPAITIRAGHRLRIWLTADFLMPRPAAHPERMFR